MQRSPVVLFADREAFGEEFTSADQLAGKTVGTGPGTVRLLDRPQERRLAAAGGADQRDEPPGVDREVDPLDGDTSS
jgi:ABC-type amino acid transport substrate-binding protein